MSNQALQLLLGHRRDSRQFLPQDLQCRDIVRMDQHRIGSIRHSTAGTGGRTDIRSRFSIIRIIGKIKVSIGALEGFQYFLLYGV